jgi:hypothetical protein
LPLNLQPNLVANEMPFVVIGAMMTVLKCRFISSGETTTHGRVFLISLPMVGSRITRKTSNRLTTTPTLPHRSWTDSRGHHLTNGRHLSWPSHERIPPILREDGATIEARSDCLVLRCRLLSRFRFAAKRASECGCPGNCLSLRSVLSYSQCNYGLDFRSSLPPDAFLSLFRNDCYCRFIARENSKEFVDIGPVQHYRVLKPTSLVVRISSRGFDSDRSARIIQSYFCVRRVQPNPRPAHT